MEQPKKQEPPLVATKPEPPANEEHKKHAHVKAGEICLYQFPPDKGGASVPVLVVASDDKGADVMMFSATQRVKLEDLKKSS